MGLRVALVSGFWGQNIGNAFFNIGGKWILENVLPEARVNYIQDQPGYRTFHRQSSGNPKNDWGLLKYLDVDIIVLEGPMLTTAFPALWGETFEALTKRGVKIVLLGAAMFRFTKEEIQVNLQFLEKFSPYILSTRDQATYDAFKDCSKFSHCGVDSAFFVPKAYAPFSLKTEPYICVNFDRWPEPDIRFGDEDRDDSDRSFEWDQKTWSLRFPKLQMRLSDKDKIRSYIGAMLDRRKLPNRIERFQIVRPEHRVNPHVTWKVYKQGNAVASDEPWTYFTVYANAAMTLSDRVHACIISLAYGRPAMLFTPSPRSQVFDRLGLNAIRERPVLLDLDYLEQERQSELEFLRAAFAGL